MTNRPKHTFLPVEALAACFLLTNFCVLALETNQIDDFNAGDANGWGGGAHPTVRAEGGADGPTDGYLEIRREIIPFHVGMKSTTRWAGDYLANNIKTLELDLNRFDLNDNEVRIRLLIFGPGGTFATKSLTPPLVENRWGHYVFGLSANDFEYVEGEVNDLEQTLSNVTTLLIRNDSIDPTLPRNHPPHVLAKLGIDNIRASDSLALDLFHGTDIPGVPGWRNSLWFLNYNVDFWPWIYHAEHGWQFVLEESAPNAIYLFDLGLGEFVFLNEITYRWIYRYGETPGWIYSFHDNRPEKRFFKRSENGSLFSVPAGLPEE